MVGRKRLSQWQMDVFVEQPWIHRVCKLFWSELRNCWIFFVASADWTKKLFNDLFLCNEVFFIMYTEYCMLYTCVTYICCRLLFFLFDNTCIIMCHKSNIFPKIYSKSRIRETKNLSTNADRSTDLCFSAAAAKGGLPKKKIGGGRRGGGGLNY